MEKTVHRPGTARICDRSTRAAGFTLVELSIVLVIIGLLVGAIVAGHEMIRAAQVRQTGKVIEQIEKAVNIFRDKYNCLPGDCAKATQFGFAANGDGNGLIYSSYNGLYQNAGQENFQFFQMLIDAKLLQDTRICTRHSTTCTANSPYYQNFGLEIPTGNGSVGPGQGGIGVINTTGVNSTSTTGYALPFQHMYFFSPESDLPWAMMPPSIAFELDAKFDDGLPLSGNILALGPRYDTGNVVDDSAFGITLACMKRTTTPYTYKTSGGNGCDIVWRAGF